MNTFALWQSCAQLLLQSHYRYLPTINTIKAVDAGWVTNTPVRIFKKLLLNSICNDSGN